MQKRERLISAVSKNKNFREKLFEKTVYRSETVCYTVRGEKSQYSEAGDSDHFLIPGV